MIETLVAKRRRAAAVQRSQSRSLAKSASGWHQETKASSRPSVTSG